MKRAQPYGTYGEIASLLYYKILMPWLSVLLLIAILPPALSFSRTQPTFLIYSLSLFGFISIFTLMDGALILGEAEVIPPIYAIFALPSFFCFIFAPRFIRMCIR